MLAWRGRAVVRVLGNLVKSPRVCRHFSRSGLSLKGSDLGSNTVRIGCSSGFWGDTSLSAPQLVQHGKIDYLVADYLSEITMSLLVAAKVKKPDMGYTPDFVQSVVPLLQHIKDAGIKVVSNAGGINPSACAQALQAAAQQSGLKLSIAMVTGDDLLGKRKEVASLGVRDIDTNGFLPERLASMNAYLGAFPIVDALQKGADIVVTGRCTDSALVLAPLIHEFGWKNTDFNELAAGSLAGHIIECGAQATGGIFTDWDQVPDWDKMGFPIVECGEDGRFILSKPPNTGGLISTGSVAEQLVYEIGDPRAYLLPDVTCDFSHVEMEEVSLSNGGTGSGDKGVLVSGAKGSVPGDSYKVSATYLDGFRAISVSPILGPRGVDKCQKLAAAILDRTRDIFKQKGLKDFDNTHVHVIGSEASYGPSHQLQRQPKEVVMWIGVQHQQKEALEIFVREIAPAGTGMAPGQTTLIGGRPKVSPVLRLFSFLYPKSKIPVSIEVDGEHVKTETYSSPSSSSSATPIQNESSAIDDVEVKTGDTCYRLEDLAFLRSGDKGNSANIGVVARKKSYLPYIKRVLTSDAVAGYFAHLLEEGSEVQRFDLPGINGLNFVLTRCLGGGGVSSLRIDPQGKGYAQMLADFKVENVPNIRDI